MKKEVTLRNAQAAETVFLAAPQKLKTFRGTRRLCNKPRLLLLKKCMNLIYNFSIVSAGYAKALQPQPR